ncbi:Type I restriction-modification system, specificity subunit S [Lacticaseibacillus paracasei subsp. paracasei Lpp22]|uniref:Type I restriction-modification system, specificity subunit S n=1 Tax=Lacticaseibacillus paracasei subsp. paracasei Lpp22 TaxID=1256221 RepID=A0A8E0IA96_LACPA|nr:Type I restriction-modification system, specificity subunit S [Lacticaseibacillus paracasei subsp. paracasei Lpp22]
MKDNQAKYPQLRFKGFTDPWEQRKLGDITKISTGKLDANAMVENGKYDFYTSGIKKYRIDVAAFEGPSITIAGNGATVGYMHLADNKFNAYQRTYVLQEFLVDRSFIFSEIGNKLPKKIKQEARTGNIPYIVMDMLTELKLSIPQNNSEQQKIGSFFKQLDDTIDLHQRKLAKLKELKQGYLQKMFPKNGAKVPELRFAGFADAWEQRKLNEVADIYDGTHQTPKYQDDGVMFLSVENIKNLTSNKFISREAFEDEFKIRPQRGDVLMTRIGDIGTANVVETDEDLAYYVSLALFKSEELNPYFLQASIYAPFVQDQIWKRTLHIAFPKKINKNAIGQVPINIPTLAEQTKIGSFFKQLDDTITLHQRKLEKLQELKKGYLQKMFC